MNKLNELEKICEILQVEKCELVIELNDLRLECIIVIRKMVEEVGKLVNEVKILNDDSGFFYGELVEDILGGEFGE